MHAEHPTSNTGGSHIAPMPPTLSMRPSVASVGLGRCLHTIPSTRAGSGIQVRMIARRQAVVS